MARKDAQLHHGQPLMVDWTPGTNIDAGDPQVVGSEVWIPHLDIEANILGAIAVPSGSAVYRVTKDGSTFAAGATVNWDGSAATSGAGDKMGVAVAAAAAGDNIVLVRHDV